MLRLFLIAATAFCGLIWGSITTAGVVALIVTI